MSVNRVEVNGSTILDLTGDSVTPQTLLQGATAHDASGVQITGVAAQGVKLSLTVTAKPGAACVATNGTQTVSGVADSSGVCVLYPSAAGTWSVTATLNGQTSDTQSITIQSGYAVTLAFFSATIRVYVDSGAQVALKKNGVTIQTKTSTATGSAAFTVSETGTYTIEATKNGQTASGTVNVVSSTTSYSLTLAFVSTTLNDNSWETIRSVSDRGEGANYWSIGARKAITLNGTVGNYTYSNVTVYAFIIGFNHNADLEGANRIHFQLAKSALSGGKSIALEDNGYGSTAGRFRMNSGASNSGGWQSSDMRTNICGTSLTSYDGTILAVIPAELRSVLKSVTKYTASYSGQSEDAVTATEDYFFLLSTFEVFGTTDYVNPYEKDKQKRYQYYSAGNTRIMYSQTNPTRVEFWWLRSRAASNNTSFGWVTDQGTSGRAGANYSYGFAPAFCV